MELHSIAEIPRHEPMVRSQVGFVPQEIMQLTCFNKITPKLTSNLMQAQTEPKLPWNTQIGIWTSHHKTICNLEGWFEV